jgi:MoaA/NifB/PqqE/SkfB family radical SAM enzyme
MKISHIFTGNFYPGKLFDIPDSPVNIMLDVTNFCNNQCLYCYNPDDTLYRKDRPDKEELIKIVSLIGQTGTREILYLGGEPFASPIIKDLLETGRRYNLFQRAVSNGSFFKDVDYCKQIKEKGLQEVGISFHSSEKEIHDKIAGRNGAFQDALSGLENCINAGIKTFVQYSPNTLNLETDVLKIAKDFSSRFGESIKFYDLNRLLPVGQGKNTKNLFLEGTQWYNFLATASELFDFNVEVHAELTPFCWINSMAEKHQTPEYVLENMHRLNRGCFMWVAQLPLDHRGRIKFCPTGQAVGPSILEVEWPGYWKTSDFFNDYRTFEWNQKCIDFQSNTACDHFYKCLGGCKYSKGSHYDVDRYSLGMNNYLNGDSDNV